MGLENPGGECELDIGWLLYNWLLHEIDEGECPLDSVITVNIKRSESTYSIGRSDLVPVSLCENCAVDSCN
jgi:hypothetical protein